MNPKYSVKPTPKEQLKYAQAFYEQSKYKEALEELRALIRYYPKSFEASEAQFYIGLVLEAQDNIYEAYKAFQRVIDKYPFSARIDEVIEHELKIGHAFMSGAKREVMGMNLPLENPAIEIFRKVVENSSYGKNAPEAQYYLGMSLKNAGRYQEAREEFERVVTNYPDSEWFAAARFQAADCTSKIAPKVEYDRELTKEAKEKFEEFIKSQPDTELGGEAQVQIDSLQEKEAEGNLKIAEFYEKQEKYEAARVYYQDVINSCPHCQSANKAQERLKGLEKK